MPDALVNPALLRWALSRAGEAVEPVARSIGTSPERVRSWLEGERRPTFRQAQKFAQRVRVPFGFLFLEEPPREVVPIPDFRVVPGEASHVSVDLREVIYSTLRKQEWWREFQIENDAEPINVVGSKSTEDGVFDVASDIRAHLGEDGDLPLPRRIDERMRFLVEKIESLGILVMRSGIVGSNTHRPLDVSEFRGFALSDPFAPIVFINAADAQTAQIFTLIHELTHIWLGETGISDVFHDQQLFRDNSKETFCNQVAAEVLVPVDQFVERWPGGAFADACSSLANRFSVSRMVIAIRALECGYIDQARFQEYVSELNDEWASRSRGTGGHYYRTSIVRNGRQFTEAVTRAALQQSLLLRDASSLLDVRPASLPALREELSSTAS